MFLPSSRNCGIKIVADDVQEIIYRAAGILILNF